jgi:hypothetical protein
MDRAHPIRRDPQWAHRQDQESPLSTAGPFIPPGAETNDLTISISSVRYHGVSAFESSYSAVVADGRGSW